MPGGTFVFAHTKMRYENALARRFRLDCCSVKALAFYHERFRHRRADRRAPRDHLGGRVATAKGLRSDTEKHHHPT